MEYNAKIYTQNESKINGRGVWHYFVKTLWQMYKYTKVNEKSESA